MKNKTALPAGPGRPREFDDEQVLDKAIIRFSEYGYHGSSVSELRHALGIAPGSMYKAWGDKRSLFLAALDRYLLLRAASISRCLADHHSGRAKIEAMMRQYAQLSSGEAGRIGCLVVATAAELSGSDAELAERIAAQQRHREQQLCQLVEQAQREGSINQALNAAITAKLLLTFQQGMRVLGKTGATGDEMEVMVAELMAMLD